MMNFDELYLEYKEFIEENSIYAPRVVKDFTFKSTYFPIVDVKHEDSIETRNRTLDQIEYYDNEEFSFTFYAQDKGDLSRNVVLNELTTLTQIFMGLHKNMRRSSFKNLPNLDKDIGRRKVNYKCRWGNVYGNIWRR